MTVLSRAWSLAPRDARAQLLRLALAADALVQALGGVATQVPTVDATADQVEAWEGHYETVAAHVDGPTVDTLAGLPREDTPTLTWSAAVRAYAQAPAAVRTAVHQLRTAYSQLGRTMGTLLDDGAIRRWLGPRATRPLPPRETPLPSDTPPHAGSQGTALGLIAMLLLAGARRGRRHA
jgi:hypothetical protein